MRARGLALVVVAVALISTRDAGAHDMRPGVLAMTEVSPGDFALRFVRPVDSRGDSREVDVLLPAGCARDGARVRCDEGLVGELRVVGLRGGMKIVIVVTRAGGQRSEWIVDAKAPRVDLGSSPPSTFTSWLWLGVTHILAGFDHLAFVLGLLLVLEVAVDRRLLATITAFTVAHSITLGLAVLGVVTVEAGPVEACIALSVLLVAREALHREPTLLRRMPWLAAGTFGLVHGLGFASALREIGLPQVSLTTTLLAFNLGVELGQLAVVGIVAGSVAVGRRSIDQRRVLGRHVHRAACYVLGAMAAWWLLERVVDLARSGG